ncbi:MAG: GTP 3',8-cyclase MoaA [Spirochaetaceae bacterium]|jgi:cyclic pyranopterin phosphate synthase|nr:GTP 3',8-cyclase MoaA [Spirochaetaceae bacterium]
MVDSLGRTIDYLRISVTDRCPARCVYCMPKTNADWIPHHEILTFEEILRIAALMAELGVSKVKITGGEPLARRGLVPFLRCLTGLHAFNWISLTTNAILLGPLLEDLLDAGISALNISLDSLDRERYRRITQSDMFDEASTQLDRALAAPIPVKINCVPVQGCNEEDIVPLARLAEHNPIAVRFIELMPLGFARTLTPITTAATAALIEKNCGTLHPLAQVPGAGPAVYAAIDGFAGKIGFISPLSHTFCSSCSRLRLTSAGILRPCLAHERGINLKAALRGGASDNVLKDLICRAAAEKPAGHNFADFPAHDYGEKPAAIMNKIGG